MTAKEAIARADAMKPNAVTEAEKLRWLTTLEGMIKDEIVDTHEGWVVAPYGGAPLALTDPLFVPPPYDGVYVFWIMAKIDFLNGEFDAYGNSTAMFANAFSAYADHINRTMAPKSAGVIFG